MLAAFEKRFVWSGEGKAFSFFDKSFVKYCQAFALHSLVDEDGFCTRDSHCLFFFFPFLKSV